MFQQSSLSTPVNSPNAVSTVHQQLPSITTSDGRIWEFLGAGSYNNAYRLCQQHGGDLVYKIPKNKHYSATELPQRAMRLWNLINCDINPPAALLDHGWVAPYISGTTPTETDICHSLIDIYNRTKRIVVDPGMPGNFIKQDVTGKTVCVDIGYALRMNVLMSRSQDSLDCWQKMSNIFDMNLDIHSKKIGQMGWALLFIAQNYPEIDNVDVLKTNSDLVAQLSELFNNLAPSDDQYILTHFSDFKEQLDKSKLSFPSIKTAVMDELNVALQMFIIEIKKMDNLIQQKQSSLPQGPSSCFFKPIPAEEKGEILEKRRDFQRDKNALEDVLCKLNCTQNLSQLTRLLLQESEALPFSQYLPNEYPVSYRLMYEEGPSELAIEAPSFSQ